MTEWLSWFFQALHRFGGEAQSAVDGVVAKTRFWQRWATTPMNERQVKLVGVLLDGFNGKLASSKWAAIAKRSPDTALRDISDLVEQGVLREFDAGGRKYQVSMVEQALAEQYASTGPKPREIAEFRHAGQGWAHERRLPLTGRAFTLAHRLRSLCKAPNS